MTLLRFLYGLWVAIRIQQRSQLLWTPTSALKVDFNGCRNPRCGHGYDQHDRYGRCNAYHCRCRGFRPITEREYQEGRR